MSAQNKTILKLKLIGGTINSRIGLIWSWYCRAEMQVIDCKIRKPLAIYGAEGGRPLIGREQEKMNQRNI